MDASNLSDKNRIVIESTTTTTPAPLRRDHHVNFEFRFMTADFYWLPNPNSPSSPIYHGREYSATTTVSTGVTISDAAPYLRMQTEIQKAMASQGLTDDDLQPLITTAINAARDEIARITNAGVTIAASVDLVFRVIREYNHLYHDDSEEEDDNEDDWMVPAADSLMVPAADSSLELLEKYEVGSGSGSGSGSEDDVITESCCCVCLEEFEDGEFLLSMPCKHIFHEDCIKKWLVTSHYCPLCRFEMPISN